MLTFANGPRDNLLHTRRETSTFENFCPTHPTQEVAARGLLRMAESVIQAKDRILQNEMPFERGKLIVLSSLPGRGKSHLLEAFANKVISAAPELKDKIFLLRKDLVLYTYGLSSSEPHFGNRPIAIIDDLFQEHQSVNTLGNANELPCLEKLIFDIYQHRRLVLVGTNFPFLAQVCEKMRHYDKMGRALSRLEELSAGSKECVLEGEDYRKTLAQQAVASGDDGFSLPAIPK